MRKAAHELNRIPTEFHENGAPEFPELPDEFNRFPQKTKRKEERSHLRKVMLLLAAVGLVLLGVLTLKVRPAASAEEKETPPQTVSTETTAQIITPAPTARIETASLDATTPTARIETASPDATPAPTEVPTPKVTPIPTPGVNVAYYYRSSQVYYAMLIVSMPQQVSSVSFRLTAPDVEEPALTIDLTPQEIQNVLYTLRVGDRDEGFDANAFFAHYAEADLVMELTYTVLGDTGEETFVKVMEPAVEDWIYWRFDSEDDVGGVAEMMFGDLFPNCFVVRIFESTNSEQQLTVGDPAEALVNGGVTISICIDGREIPAEVSHLYKAKYRYADDDTIYYDYALVIPIPEDFPQHGIATMTLIRKLTHTDTIIMKVKDVEY